MESTRGVSFHPIVRGSPPRFFLNFLALLCSFLMGLMRLGLDYSRLRSRDIPCGVKNRMLDKAF